MPKSKDHKHSKEIIKQCEAKLSDALRLQLRLAEVQAYLEGEKMRKQKLACPHWEASLSDLQKIQARFRKWRSKLELVERQERLKIEKELITINEAKNEQRTER